MNPPIDPHSPTTSTRVPSRAMSEGEKSETTQPRDVDALLRKQDWGRIRVQLLLFARPRAKSEAKANDVVQEAMMRVFDPTWEPWDPSKYPNVVDFLTSIISRLLVNE